MEGETQNMEATSDTEGEKDDTPISAHPAGYLTVLAREGEEPGERVFAVSEGENAVGRSSACEVAIAARSLSRKHAIILVEGPAHFLMDCGSRNKTYRRDVALRPNAYYELTDECEVMFGDVKCVYHIGALPPATPTPEDEEQTQSYQFEEGGGASAREGSDAGEAGEGGAASNVEATQPYDFEESAMECAPTVPYNMDDSDGDDNDSVASSLLLGGGADAIATQLYPADEPPADSNTTKNKDGNDDETDSPVSKTAAMKKQVCFEKTATGPPSDAESEDTLPYKSPAAATEEEEEEKEGTPADPREEETALKPSADTATGDEEPTPAVNARERGSASVGEEDSSPPHSSSPVGDHALLDATVPYTVLPDYSAVIGDSCLEPTVPYDLGAQTEDPSAAESEGKSGESSASPKVRVQRSLRGKQKAGTKAVTKKGAVKNAESQPAESHDTPTGSHDDSERNDATSHDQVDSSHDPDSVKPKPKRGRPKKMLSVKPSLKTLDTVVSMDIGVSCHGDGGTVALETVEPESPDVETKPLQGAGIGLEQDRTGLDSIPKTKRGVSKRGRGRGKRGRGQSRGGKAPAATLSVVSMEIGVPTLEPASPGSNERSAQGQSTKVTPLKGFPNESHEPEASSHDKDNQLDLSSVASRSNASEVSSASSSVKPRRKRGRGPSLPSPSPSSGRSRRSSHTSSEGSVQRPHPPLLQATPTSEPPGVMFTGITDEQGERTVRELGGRLVDSVYDCTHLITDKVRRTVKFLCCLSRGCLIVSDSWLDACGSQRHFLPARPFLIHDRAAERQHSFSLAKSHESAKLSKVLAGVKVYLTAHTKPDPAQMKDIVECAGGEVLQAPPTAPGEGVVIVACTEDLPSCQVAMATGVPVHSTELILGGVLRQELDLRAHLLSAEVCAAVAGRRKRCSTDTSAAAAPPAKRKRKI